MSTTTILSMLAILGIIAAGFVRNKWLTAFAFVYLVVMLALLLITMAKT